MLKEILQAIHGTTTKLKTARKIILTGASTGEGIFDGNSDITIPIAIPVKKVQKTESQRNYTITATFRKQLNVVNILLEVSFKKNIGSVSFDNFIPSEYRPSQNISISRFVGGTAYNTGSSSGILPKGTMYGGITTTGNVTISSNFISETGTGESPIIFCITYIRD